MKTILRLAPAIVLLAFLSRPAAAQAPAAELFTPQTRGPIHEAFLQPIDGVAELGAPVPKAPPPAINELPPDQQPDGKNVQWIPGYWAWDADTNAFLWVSGFWRDAPPDRQYVPGYWTQAPEGWRWVAGFWAAAQDDAIQTVPEPPAPLATEPSLPAPDDNSTYVPGVWVYREQRFAWRPGYWTAFRPGFVWVPAHYVWTPAGYLFIDGYWDLPLDGRGLLFAPVVFTGSPWLDPAWCYRPSYVVRFGAIFDSAFYNRRHHHYYFGDYYGPSYVTLGFRPWYTGAGRYDPAFGYYAWQQRGTPNWFAKYQATYVARANGSAALPPRTFVQQTKGVQVVTPLGQFAQTTKNVTLVKAPATNAPTVAIQRTQALVQARKQLEVAATKTPSPTIHSLRLPAAGTPQVTTPPAVTSTPSVTAPKYSPPAVTTPKYTPPVVTAPKIAPPPVTTPKYTPPAVTTPKYTPPPVTTPKYTPPPATTPK